MNSEPSPHEPDATDPPARGPKIPRVVIALNLILPLLILVALGFLFYGLFFRGEPQDTPAAAPLPERVVLDSETCQPSFVREEDGLHIYFQAACGSLHLHQEQR